MKKSNSPDYPMRLQVYLARSGYCSRRKAGEIVKQGKVKVNNVFTDNPAQPIGPEDAVYVNGTYVEPMEYVYIALNKPKGYVCSNADPHEELFARDLINVPQFNSLFHVGRLDRDSTGLIFYTNDGDFGQQISHPSGGLEKEYLVHIKEKIDRNDLQRVKKEGLVVNRVRYSIIRYAIRSSRSISLVLNEGKNREIRKMFSHLGYSVVSLQRVRIGTICLGKLPKGRYRMLKKEEIQSLLKGENTL